MEPLSPECITAAENAARGALGGFIGPIPTVADATQAVGLQHLVAGAIHGMLAGLEWINIESGFVVDDNGDLLPEVTVIGRDSGTRLRVHVEIAP